MLKPEKNFMNMAAPPGYKGGIGRGAIGFTTRADLEPLGPARRGKPKSEETEGDEDQNERFKDADGENGLLAGKSGSKDDKEADHIYDLVERRRSKRKTVDAEPEPENEIADQFSDLKSALGDVKDDEWLNIPEASDMTRKNKRLRQEESMNRRSYALPDSVLMANMQKGSLDLSIPTSSKESELSTDGRDKVLNYLLDRASKSSTDDKNGGSDVSSYLSAMDGNSQFVEASRLRESLVSLTNAEPTDPQGWIGLARAEELAHKFQKARIAIEKGTSFCSDNEGVWLESIRLHQTPEAKVVAAKAVKHIPTSIALWLKAAELEDLPAMKRAIIHQALEKNPTNAELWVMAGELEETQQDRRLVFEQATELIPHEPSLWIALSKETDGNEKIEILKNASQNMPSSLELWTCLVQAMEHLNRSQDSLNETMKQAVKLANVSVKDWLQYAQLSEKQQMLGTTRAIIGAQTLTGPDLELLAQEQNIETARFAFKNVTLSEDLYHKWIDLEILVQKNENDVNSNKDLHDVLGQARKAFPTSESIILRFIEHCGPVSAILEDLPQNDKVLLALVHAHISQNEHDMALKLLERAENEKGMSKPSVFSVHAKLLFAMEQYDNALELTEKALTAFPTVADLYLCRAKTLRVTKGLVEDVLVTGTKSAPGSVPLWIELSRFHETHDQAMRSRFDLSQAAIHNQKNGKIWLERAMLEKRAGKDYSHLISSGLGEVPSYGPLWAEHLKMSQKIRRKAEIVKAITACEGDSYVLTAVGLDYWASGKGKAKSWLEKAVQADPNIGDSWLWLYAYTSSTSPESVDKVLNDFLKAGPTDGLLWSEVFVEYRDPKAIFLETAKQMVNPFN